MKEKNTTLVVLNTITFAGMLYINYASSTKMFEPVTIADVAHKYDTLFAPANYAFSIWSVIFFLCIGLIIYQFTLIKNDKQQYIQRTGLWFTISNIANGVWCYCWVNEWLGLSVLLILIVLFSLFMLTIKLKLELFDEPVNTILFVWWPIAFYLGWIMVATIACIASWLVYINWNGFKIAADVWTIIMIIIALLLYIFLIRKRNLRESAVVGIWAFIAIAVKQWHVHQDIAFTAVGASLILFVLILMQGFKNWRYALPQKIKRKEWK